MSLAHDRLTRKAVRQCYRLFGLSGLRTALKACFSRAPIKHHFTPPGSTHPVELRIPSSDVATYEQVFVHREYAFRASPAPKVIVDAGANIGLASVYFANRFPAAQIIAIEPEEGNFALLKRNVAPYPNIAPVHAALWYKVGQIELVDPGRGNWGFRTQAAQEGQSCASVSRHLFEAITIDKILSDFSLDVIDILKVDIEGAEKEVFQTASTWLNRVRALIIELHEHFRPGCNRVFYHATDGFDQEWRQGETYFLVRGEWLSAMVN